MTICRIFEAKELENVLEEKGIAGDMLFDLLSDACSDTAVRWQVEKPDSENDFEAAPYETATNIINEYMISQGCIPDEEVFIYFSW